MAAFDIFNNQAFSMVSLTSAVNANPYRPGFLGSLPIFGEKRITTTTAAIEIKDGVLNLIPTSQRGAPLQEGALEKRNLFHQETVRIAEGHTINAASIQNIRAFGSESELQGVQNLLADRLNGPTGLIAKVEYTWENLRLGAIQGIVKDADGSTLVDWYGVIGQSQPTEIAFDLANAAPASGAVRTLCNGVTRAILRAVGSLWLPGQSYVLGLAGDNFWDALTAHKEIRETYLATQEAAALRTGTAFESFNYGGITWVNYRGSDDGTTVGINTDKVKFVPVGVPGLFDMAFAPSESLDYANTPGMPMYSLLVLDDERNFWVRPEVYSYPLPICTRPKALQSGRKAT